jgi:hypothetical protein
MPDLSEGWRVKQQDDMGRQSGTFVGLMPLLQLFYRLLSFPR